MIYILSAHLISFIFLTIRLYFYAKMNKISVGIYIKYCLFGAIPFVNFILLFTMKYKSIKKQSKITSQSYGFADFVLYLFLFLLISIISILKFLLPNESFHSIFTISSISIISLFLSFVIFNKLNPQKCKDKINSFLSHEIGDDKRKIEYDNLNKLLNKQTLNPKTKTKHKL